MVSPPWLWDFLIITAGILILMIISNFAVKLTEFYIDRGCRKKLSEEEVQEAVKEKETKEERCRRDKIGFIIGRCENILILTFVLLGEMTALIIIIGVKGLVRKEEIERKPGYYLVGTLLNLTISILISILVKVLVLKYGISYAFAK
ncbi:MAG: hypothetical protein ACTSSG_00740 [Candidatus Heimdallarchaeaceae archaeon]